MNVSALLNDYVYMGYVLAFGLAAVVMLGGIFRARRFSNPDTRRGLIALLGLSGCWALAQLGFLIAPAPTARVVIYEAGLIAGFATVGAWLYFCSAFTGRTEHQQRGPRRAWLLVFALVVATKVTNPWHGLYFSTAQVTEPFPHLAIQHGALYWTSNGLAYALTAIGFFMLYEGFTRLGRNTAPLAGLVGLMVLPLALNVAGAMSPALLDINHDALGVAGFAVGVLFVLRDQVEEAQRSIATAAPTLLLGPAGKVRNYNRAAAALCPALEQQAAGPSSLAAVWPEAAAALRGGSPLTARQNGHVMHFRPTEASLNANDYASRHVVFTDITKERDRERRRMELVLENTGAMIFEVDFNTGDKHRTGATEKVLGMPPDQVPAGDAYFDVVVHPEDAPDVRRFFHGLLNGKEQPRPVSYRTNPALGPVRWLEEQMYYPGSATGTNNRLLGITRDITARRQYEQGLREAKEHAEEVSALKSSILANMSHEVRTPLTGIIGFADLLSVMDLGPEAQDFVVSIRRSGLRLLETLNSVLSLSQLEAGAVDLRREEVAVDDLLRDLAEDLCGRASAEEAPSLHIETGPEPILLNTDPSALSRVLTNLLSNAIKFTPPDGEVNVHLTSGGDAVILRVQDTGVGIAPGFLPDLFTPFKQESNGDARYFEGNGLGLSITKQLVDLLGGTIAVDSTKGEGSTFTVTLPRMDAQSAVP